MDAQISKGTLGTLPNMITSIGEARRGTFSRSISVLLPLLAFYIFLVFMASSSTFSGDEGGYVYNATRMLHGPAVTPQDLRLWWGPGYPMVLVPFVALGLPWIAVKILNAVFLFGAIAYCYALLRKYIPRTPALIITLCLGLYPPLLRDLHHLSSEHLTVFLMCGFMFHFCALYNNPQRFRLHLVAASMYLAYLALTKVFFGYVIVAALLLSFISMVGRRMHKVRTAIPVFLLALLWTVPYLAYTYSLTGRAFYWGTSGGMSLYWMSSPYANEYGSWFSVKDVKELPQLAPHREFFATLEGLSDVERDDAYKKRAIYNITHHPAKYLVNWSANIGRLLFSYPFSLGPQSLSTYFYMAPNMFVVVLFLLSIIPAIMRRNAIPFELWALLLFVLTAFGGSTLLSAYDRQFRPLVPALCVWMAFIYIRLLRVELRANSELAGSALNSE